MPQKIPNGVIGIASIDAFNSIVNSFKENLIVVDFYADWCAPCKGFKPVFERTQREYFNKGVIFARLDTEQLPEISEQFSIKSIPTLMLIRNNKGLKKHIGAINQNKLRELINQYI